ncbi:AzlC family ABC transporter permease [Streptomyces mobaraensis NBRC 13819 = DSM 40847]|nr:AzlC family ABC transporter permease [Streptomyces mobaraensis]QTT76156.1 AzlC family ABC transporter permease [Streptomyces mobaraensis NBRC 13819 = DSM 40847]
MRSSWRTLDRAVLRNIGAVTAAMGVVGASFGAIAVSAGQPAWVPVIMSLAVFAGGAQFATLDIVLGGGGAVAAVAAGLLLNARLLVYGLTVADVLALRRPARLLGSHLLADQAVAFAGAERDPVRRRAAYFVCGGALFVTWNVGTLLGALAGRAVGDAHALGLDAAEPMVLLALVLPALRETGPRRAALAGAAVALAVVPFLPNGVPVLLALLGLPAALWGVPAAGRNATPVRSAAPARAVPQPQRPPENPGNPGSPQAPHVPHVQISTDPSAGDLS